MRHNKYMSGARLAQREPESGLMSVYRRIYCDCRQSIVNINARPVAMIAMLLIKVALEYDRAEVRALPVSLLR